MIFASSGRHSWYPWQVVAAFGLMGVTKSVRRVKSLKCQGWKEVLEDLVNGLLEHFHGQHGLNPLLP